MTPGKIRLSRCSCIKETFPGLVLCWRIKQTTCSSSEAADTYPGLASARCDSHSLLHPSVCTNTPLEQHGAQGRGIQAGKQILRSWRLGLWLADWLVWSHQKLPLKKMGIFPMDLISVQKGRDSPHYRLSAFRSPPEISKGNRCCYGKSPI